MTIWRWRFGIEMLVLNYFGTKFGCQYSISIQMGIFSTAIFPLSSFVANSECK